MTIETHPLDSAHPESTVTTAIPPGAPSPDVGAEISGAPEAHFEVPAAKPAAERKEDEELKQRIHNELVGKLRAQELNRLPEPQQRLEVRQVVEHLLDRDAPMLDLVHRRQMLNDLIDEIFGCGPIERLLRDATLNDILVNGPHEVYIERRGKLEPTDVRFRDDAHLLEIIHRIVARVGRRVDESSPMVDARLPDGSRVNAVIPPLSLKGPILCIRRFPTSPLKIRDLLSLKTFTPEMVVFMEAAIKAKLNIMISGGTGSGKTTLLNMLSGFLPNDQRIVTIEDSAELRLQQRHWVQLESRPPNLEGKGEITIRDLLRNSLRMRPDRIIIGECRGAEALDMLQAMNTGHEGSMTTLHANTPRDALSRLEMMIMMTGMELPVRVMRQQIASAIHLLIHMERLQGGTRRITSVTEIAGMEEDTVTLQELFVFRQHGVDPSGKAYGDFEATGVWPHCAKRLEAAGIRLPPHLLQKRVLLHA